MDYRFLSDRFYKMREQQLRQRGLVPSCTDQQVSKIVLDAALTAIENVQSGIRKTRVQAVPLGTGLGKSSAAYALIAAFAMNDMNFSTAYVVPTIKMGIDAQEGIEALIGEGSTTLWTSLHKHKGVDRKRAFEELKGIPSRLVDKAILGAQRIVIVTHKQLEHELATGKTEGILHYMSQPRTVVFIDEHPELVQQVNTAPEAVQRLHDQLTRHNPDHPWLPVMAKAVHEMSLTMHGGNGQRYVPAILIPAEAACTFDDCAGLSLWDLTDPQASQEVRLGEQAKLQQVVDFLSAASQGRAFYSRKDYQFFAYSLHLDTDYSGFVLLDATSELAGLVTLNPDVRLVPVPAVNYERLSLFSMDMPKKFRKVRDALKVAGTSQEYGQYIREYVLANSDAGDDVLVVVHKEVLSRELIGVTSDDPNDPTNWEGRKVNTQNWGAGVGSNKFRDKTHVFMFGSFYLPGAATIALAHGWSQQPLSVEGLAHAESVRRSGDVYSPRGDYRQVHEGNVLRWVKQLAMRGTARSVDGEGKCLAMKLFLTLELGVLMPNLHRLFPNAPAPVPAALPAYLTVEPVGGRLALVHLAMTSKLPYISAEDIQILTGIPTRKLSYNFGELVDTLKPLGWSLMSAVELGMGGRMKYLVHVERYLLTLLQAA
jgi:hypothetical protein